MVLCSLGRHVKLSKYIVAMLSLIPPHVQQYLKSLSHLSLPPQTLLQPIMSYQNFLLSSQSKQGKQFHILLVDDVKPLCVNTPRPIPSAYCDKLKADLDLLQEQQIIASITTSTEQSTPIVIIPPKNTDHLIHMCVIMSLSHLNHYVHQEQYQSYTPAQAVVDITATNARFFTTLYTLKGYHQCHLDQDSQALTNFL